SSRETVQMLSDEAQGGSPLAPCLALLALARRALVAGRGFLGGLLPLIAARELPARALHRVAGLVETRSGKTLTLVERLAGDVLALVGGLLAASAKLVQEAAHPVSLSRMEHARASMGTGPRKSETRRLPLGLMIGRATKKESDKKCQIRLAR